VRAAFGRDGTVSSVTLRLAPSGTSDGLDALKSAVAADRSLGVQILRESTYYEKISSGTSAFITILGTIVAIFFSIGATIGAMITMYSSIGNREREIGTLRALGFSRRGIMFSFLVESVLLSLAGGVVGALLALLMRFVKFSTMNFQTFSEVVFSFSISTAIIVSAFFFAALMGLAGGFLPALRAASVSPIKALRA
jgi:putative ABC transport system permease protein